jgi:hypothetical protein
VNGVLLVAPSAVLLEARRKEFVRCMQDVLAQGQEQRATCQVHMYRYSLYIHGGKIKGRPDCTGTV